MADFQTLIEEISKISWANHYHEYLSLYQKGLKKKAKASMREFIKELKDQDKVNRRNFIDTIYGAGFVANEYSTLIPVNLYNEVIKPEIESWIKEDPDNWVPYRWSSNLDHVKKAVQINPNDQIALINLANQIVGKISMNQHEINSGFSYDGNASDDISLIIFFEQFIANIQNIEKREIIRVVLAELKNCALLYEKNR